MPDDNSLTRRYCSRSHAQLARWKRLVDIPDSMLKALPPRARQVYFGRKKGASGGRPAVAVPPEKRDDVVELANQGWGRRAIASRLLISERAVRNLLDELA
jgi:DNA-binding NarL/FixJ family response regulator